MPFNFPGTAVVPSVLDRLLDDKPKETEEFPLLQAFDIRALKRAVARDIESLLNTRCLDTDEQLDGFPNARASMLDFGITDLSSLSLLDPGDQAYLRDKIRIAIQRHEPRLGSVSVRLDSPKGTERMLRFRVDAHLEAAPTRPPVRFDATLQLSTNSYQIREG